MRLYAARFFVSSLSVLKNENNESETKTAGNPCCKYAHYYLGCKFRMTFNDGLTVEGSLWSVTNYGAAFGSNYIDVSTGKEIDVDIENIAEDGNFQLFLFDPAEMPQKQISEYYALCKRVHDARGVLLKNMDTPESIDYLFRNHIDAFDLIKNGYAINSFAGTPSSCPSPNEGVSELFKEIEARQRERNKGAYIFAP